MFPSFTFTSGVRQGCPLSGIIFALILDILLRKVARALCSDSVVKGYADDTALVLQDYEKELPTLCHIFQEFSLISGLELNVDKTTFIPLWPFTSVTSVKTLLREICPPWANFQISGCGKYLGFFVGPSSANASWDGPIAKYEKRVLQWSSKHLGLFLTIFAYVVYDVNPSFGKWIVKEPFGRTYPISNDTSGVDVLTNYV